MYHSENKYLMLRFSALNRVALLRRLNLGTSLTSSCANARTCPRGDWFGTWLMGRTALVNYRTGSPLLPEGESKRQAIKSLLK